jgi:hypothetical protein
MITARHRLQRCEHFVPGLRSQPWWSETEIPIARVLELNYPVIRDEFSDVLLSGRLRIHPQSRGGPRKNVTDGDWNIFELCSKGRLNEGNALEAPMTAKILRSYCEEFKHPAGLAYFSVLQPGVHVAPHCGPTNSRIRIHLGLHIPPGATMRVGDQSRKWEEGRCLIFDDSWEHEVVNDSSEPRAVLLVDTWHPDLTPEQRELMAGGQTESPHRRRQREGWYKQFELESCCQEDVVARTVRTLGADRLQLIRASAVKALSSRNCIAARAASFFLQKVDGPRPVPVATPKRETGFPSDLEFLRSLSDLFAEGDDLTSFSDCIHLLHVYSLFWLSAWNNVQTMNRYLDRYPTKERRILRDQLVAVHAPARMTESAISQLTRYQIPFGILVALIVAAMRVSQYKEEQAR